MAEPTDNDRQDMLDSLNRLARRIANGEVTCFALVAATNDDKGPYSLGVGDFENNAVQIIAGLTVFTNDLCHLIGHVKEKHADSTTH